MKTGDKSRSKTTRAGLVNLILRRVFLFSLAAMALQMAIVTFEYANRPEYLAQEQLNWEAKQFAKGLTIDGDKVQFDLPDALAIRYIHTLPTGYQDIEPGNYARLTTEDGQELFSNCDVLCSAILLKEGHDSGTWIRWFSDQPSLSFAGSQDIILQGTRLRISLLVWHDPEWRFFIALLEELKDHMVAPMLLILVFVIGGISWSVSRVLQPVREAARQAEMVSVGPRRDLASDRMPEEIFKFAQSVDNAFKRVEDLVQGQRTFASAMSHELRTPIAVAVLELEQLDHPGARNALRELGNVVDTLEKLTDLARLEVANSDALREVSLGEFCEDIVGVMAPFVINQGLQIELELDGPSVVTTNPAYLELLMRSLIDNAIKHAGKGATITVCSGPGPVIGVRDNGAGAEKNPNDLLAGKPSYPGARVGLGLRIVSRIAELLTADILANSSPGEGFSIFFTLPLHPLPKTGT